MARFLVLVALVLHAGCKTSANASEETPPPVAPPEHEARVELPPSLRGLPVGPADVHGVPTVVPCVTCHDGSADATAPLPSTARGIAGPHVGLRVEHGPLTCASCHHPTDRAALRLADGRGIPLEETMTLCTQCHGQQARSYVHGAHGGMRGHWDLSRGPRTRNHCIACHDPHGPKFGTFEPVAGPRDRFFPQASGGESHD